MSRTIRRKKGTKAGWSCSYYVYDTTYYTSMLAMLWDKSIEELMQYDFRRWNVNSLQKLKQKREVWYHSDSFHRYSGRYFWNQFHRKERHFKKLLSRRALVFLDIENLDFHVDHKINRWLMD